MIADSLLECSDTTGQFIAVSLLLLSHTADQQVLNVVSMQQTQEFFEVGGQFDHRDKPASGVVQELSTAAPSSSSSTHAVLLRRPR